MDDRLNHTQIIMEITNQVRIQQHTGYWYSVDDLHLDAGCDGCTISYWESGYKMKNYICMDKEEALAVADAIYKLFKGN